MDDQNQKPEIQQSNLPPLTNSTPKIDQSSQQNLGTTQALHSNGQEILTTTNVETDSLNEQTTVRKSVPLSSSIYPDVDNDKKENLDKSDLLDYKNIKSTKTKLIIVIVIILGAIIATQSLLGLVGWLRLLSFGFAASTSKLVITIDVIYLLIGIGLILRKEFTRICYVLLALISLVLLIYGTYHIYNLNNSLSKSQSNLVTQQQNEITQYQNNNSITANQKQQITQELQQNLAQDKALQKLNNTSRRNEYIKLIPGYLIAIIPLVFITRPSVKEVFA